MNKIFIQALKIMQKVATALIWNYCLFHILGEVDSSEYLTSQEPSTV